MGAVGLVDRCWHFVAQPPKTEMEALSPATAPEMLVGISWRSHQETEMEALSPATAPEMLVDISWHRHQKTETEALSPGNGTRDALLVFSTA